MARKVFDSDTLTKAVHYLCSGAPNAYIWNEQAVHAALLRRRVTGALVRLWFGTKLRVAEAYDYAWDGQARAFALDCEFIAGGHVQLLHPFTEAEQGQLGDLRRQVLRPLRQRLVEAGLDGLVWQAGRGNPVALNNFLRDDHCGDNGAGRWVWIDLESGVPALVPINPLDLIGFYLPKSWRHRCALFDDVDVPKLRAYLSSHQGELEGALGAERLTALVEDIDALEDSQRRWKSVPRHQRGITYRLLKGRLSQSQADWYTRHPVLWYARELSRAYRPLFRLMVGAVIAVAAQLRKVNLLKAVKALGLVLISQRYRTQVAHEYVAGRIARWQQRRQMRAADAAELHRGLEADETSAYLTDFGMHLGVKPVVKTMQWWVLPTLLATGQISPLLFGLLWVQGGAIVRTLYTLGRLCQNAVRRQELPWVALVVGMLPVVGNLAFPLQLLFSGAHAHAPIARFIIYDTFGRIGRWTPIWGGPDTLTEHLFNRLPHWLIRRRRPAPPAACPEPPADGPHHG